MHATCVPPRGHVAARRAPSPATRAAKLAVYTMPWMSRCGGPLADAWAPDVCSRRFSGTSFLRKIRSLLGFLIEAQKKVAKVVAGVRGGVKSYKTLLLFVDIYMISL